MEEITISETLWDILGKVYFDTKEHAEQAIKEFKDELLWYFTKFESRMD